MTDLKQAADEIAEAIFRAIEQDRSLIKQNLADVVHRELAVRFPQKEHEPEDIPSPAMPQPLPWFDDSWIHKYLHDAESLRKAMLFDRPPSGFAIRNNHSDGRRPSPFADFRDQHSRSSYEREWVSGEVIRND